MKSILTIGKEVNAKRSFSLLSYLLLLSSLAALAQSEASAADDNLVLQQHPAAVRAYWTEERLRDARPMSLPETEEPAKALASGRASANTTDSITFSEAVQLPGESDGDLAVRLFDPDDDPWSEAEHDRGDLTSKADSGSVPGAFFTQSRVAPTAAVEAFPYKFTGSLFFAENPDFSDVRRICTAALIARRLILTAGHCVLNASGLRRNFAFVPAFSGGRAPFGIWFGTRVWVALSWLRNPTVPNYADFAVIELADQSVGGRTVAVGDHLRGWLGTRLFAGAGHHITSLGYPGNLDRGQHLQQTHAQIFDQDAGSLAVLFGTFQGGGSSGGPVVVDFGVTARGQPRNGNQIIAVNSFGPTDLTGASVLNEEFLRIFQIACAASPGNCGSRTVASSAGGSSPRG